MPLLTTKTLPPGHWRFEQLDAAGKSLRKFHSSGTFLSFCKEILQVRLGNGLARATIEEVMADADAAQCTRLGNDPRYCGSGSGPVQRGPIAVYGGAPKPCLGCGGKRA